MTRSSAYQLLHQLQCQYIPRHFGIVRLWIISGSAPLHPITDVVQGVVLEYIPCVSMEKLQSDIDVSEQEAERISSDVMAGLCEGNHSLVIIDFGEANIRQPATSDEDWRRIINDGPDTRYMRREAPGGSRERTLEEDSYAVRDVESTLLGHRGGEGGPVPWSPSLDDHPQYAFELIHNDENRPDTKFWKDWMWEVSSLRYKVFNHNTELVAYRHLHRLQGRYIPHIGVRLRITPESTTLHPITKDSFSKAERISSQIMEALRAIEAENCVLHNDIHIENVVLRDGTILQ
ncbi:hypothetical protein IW262DRAFT_1464216 [Armillaria fumosa]|nr:hypothetical protein IW262DRAFT_1464216 [Armillaria fumosa]